MMDVAMRMPDLATVEASGAVKRDSFFARNRHARSSAPAAPATQAAPSAYPREFLFTLYERMVLIREFEEGVKFLFLEGAMPGTIHQCQGQEATAVGVCAALEQSDFITSTFRGHGHALAKGLTPEELLFERAAGYGIPGHQVDGNNVLAVYEAARAAALLCRRGRGPVLLELLTYRRTGHSRRDACNYQPQEEREEWLGRDPIARLGRL